MPGDIASDVNASFDAIVGSLDAEIEIASQTGADAFASHQYDKARLVLDRVDQLKSLKERVKSLQQEWNALIGSEGIPGVKPDVEACQRRNYGRLKKGRKTPQQAYYRPILQALVDLGGSANLHDVLDRVEPMVKDQLKPIDYESLPSDPSQIRWRNTAQWARYQMVRDGLLRDDSPRGTWEITEKGRQWLAKQ